MENTLRFGFSKMALALFCLFSSIAWGQTTVTYTAMTNVACPAEPIATISAPPTGVVFSQISRGSGVTCSTASGSISGSAFNGNLTTNITAQKWYTYSITNNAAAAFVLNNIKVVSRVSSASGSPKVSVQYSINGGAKTALGEFTPTAGAAPYTITPSAALTVAPNQVVNIYIIPYSLTAAGTTCRVEVSTSATITMQAVTGPTITATPASLDFGNTGLSNISNTQSFNVGGVNLTSDVTVTSPSSEFQLSANGTSGWASSLALPFGTGTITNVPVYVRFQTETLGLKSGDISLTSAGATTKNVAVSGTGIYGTPVATAASGITTTSFFANWNAVTAATEYKLDVYSGEQTINNNAEIFNNTGILTDDWTSTDVTISGGYLQLLRPTSVLTSPAIDFNTLENSSLVFKARTFGGSGSTAEITVSISVDNGVNWNSIGTRTPTTNSLVAMAPFDLSSYVGSQVKIKFQTLNASGSVGVGIDDIVLTADQTIGSITYVPGYQDLTVAGTSQEVTGLTSETSYKYLVRAFFGTETSVNSNQIDVTTLSTKTIWNGTSWSNGTPTTSLDAVINATYSTATNGVITANTLTVNSGKSIIVNSGTAVNIVNQIVNNADAADFTVENNANIIQLNASANTGAITIKRNSAPIVRLDHTLWSSPVLEQNLFNFSPNTLTNRFYTYQTSTNTYVNSELSASSTFTLGKGFAVRAPNYTQTSPATAWEGKFVGIPNNGNVPFILDNSGSGFNLVGNPYPSTIDAATFIANNPAIGGTIYFYAHTLAMNSEGNFPAGTNYAMWNGTGPVAATAGTGTPAVTPNGIIQVGQGFIVKANQAGTINFTNAMRVTNTDNQFFRSSNSNATSNVTEKHRFWLNLTGSEGTAFSQILIGYIDGATDNSDRNFDGPSFGNSGSMLSSKISNSNYAIQGRALPFNQNDTVQLGFRAGTTGSYTIKLSSMDGLFSAAQDIFIKDNLLQAIHNLKAGDYTFASEAGTFDQRFEIVYQNIILSNPDASIAADEIKAYKKDNVLHVDAKKIIIKDIAVYDTTGKRVYVKNNINNNSVVLTNLSIQNQVLLLRITSDQNTATTIKVIY